MRQREVGVRKKGMNVLLAARAHDADTATSDVLEAGVEAEFCGTDVEKHAVKLLRSTSGRKPGARRNDKATLVGW